MMFWQRALLAAVVASPGIATTATIVQILPGATSSTYQIRNYGRNSADVTGTSVGHHSLTVGNGTGGSADIMPGAAPALTVDGTIGVGQANFVRMSASYTYDVGIYADATDATRLEVAFSSNGVRSNETVGYLTGVIKFSGTSTSDALLRIDAQSEYGSASINWSCDGGDCYGPTGNVPTGVSVPYSFALTANDFGYGCDPLVSCFVAGMTRAFSRITLSAQAGVGYTTDNDGISTGGSVFALLDPVYSLNANFFGDHNLNIDDYGLGVTSAPPPSAVPEPSLWALLIAGFGFAGCGLRRRRYTASAA